MTKEQNIALKQAISAWNRRSVMSKLNLKPFSLDKNTWCYEEKTGLLIIHQDRNVKGEYIQTHHIKIPLRKIKGYLKRRYK